MSAASAARRLQEPPLERVGREEAKAMLTKWERERSPYLEQILSNILTTGRHQATPTPARQRRSQRPVNLVTKQSHPAPAVTASAAISGPRTTAHSACSHPGRWV